MLFKSLVPLTLLTGLTSAQTPEGFVPKVVDHLDVIFGTKSVTPGLALTKAETAKIPTIGTKTALNGTYLFVMIDLDVPASFTNPSAGARRTNLHGMLTGWKTGATTTADGVHVLETKDKGPKAYIGPGPPAETPPHAHRYVQLLFETPATFTVPSSENSQIQAGIGFDIAKFVKAAALKDPIAANYFNVTG